MFRVLQTFGWLACVAYSTIPSFWLLIHPFAHRWRSRRRSPYRLLLPLWFAMWIALAALTAPWRTITLYSNPLSWIPAIFLFATGIWLYIKSGKGFSAKQLGGLPELHPNHPDQRLVTTGIRQHLRHPVYFAHLLEMIAWSLGSGLAVCYALTAFAIITGAIMIRMEDNELEERFLEFKDYEKAVPAIFPSCRQFALPIAISAILVSSAFLTYAYSRRADPMLFQHGTPEVPRWTAFAIMNPFRTKVSEETAERLIHDLRTTNCSTILHDLGSEDEQICPTMRENKSCSLIWREDRSFTRQLVYELPDVNSRLWIIFRLEEGGFVVRSVSLIR